MTGQTAVTHSGDGSVRVAMWSGPRNLSTALMRSFENRPDTVVVEMGVDRADPRGALHIATHGAARVCGRAAAEVITGKGAGA